VDLTLNGRRRTVGEALTVGGLVDTEVRERRGVAVAVDGEVVPRADWDTTFLTADARVELVGATQGG
jgi:sulfur carrier protein